MQFSSFLQQQKLATLMTFAVTSCWWGRGCNVPWSSTLATWYWRCRRRR